MKLLIIVDSFPSSTNPYSGGFVYSRVKEYIKIHQCLVCSFNIALNYEFNGIEVRRLKNETGFISLLNTYKPDRVLVHFAFSRIISLLKHVDCRVVIWVHGYEALGWYRRLFNYRLNQMLTLKYIKRILGNIKQQFILRRFILKSNSKNKVYFIFVSEWMRKVTQEDTLVRVKNCSILANPVDDRFYAYYKKREEQRFHILIIRPFTSKKYAVDLVIKAIYMLSLEPIFDSLYFTIYGEGPLWASLVSKINSFKNVSLNNYLLDREGMLEAFLKHGILLCPTRQDAQGVTMCEAMSCGLVPVTSRNSGVPEFVMNELNGFTENTVIGLIKRIKQLVLQPEVFNQLSYNAAHSIRHKAGIDLIIRNELAIMS